MISIYEELVDAVILRLAGTPQEPKNLGLFAIQIDKLPQFRGLHEKVMDPKKKSRITVSFYMQRFGTEREPTEIDLVRETQESDIFFVLSFASRELYGDTGMYTLIELGTKLLIGFRFWELPISAFSTEILTFEEKLGTWIYQCTFRVRGVPVQGIEDFFNEGDAPWLTRLDIDENPCAPDIVDNQGNEFDIDGYKLTTDN